MHCKDTILRTQNNWPYSKLIPNSGNALGDLRICEHCGFPIFEGYYIAGSFYCCEQCAIEGGYDGNKGQFEQDLKDGNDPHNSMWNEVYWSQWDNPIND